MSKKAVFRFKQFDIKQEVSAMKIGTDGVLLGAWCKAEAQNILDIGTGTGLIALMCAQKHPKAKITAIEIEPNAAGEARYNFENSPWKNRLNLIQTGFLAFQTADLFDTIISNPPFFDEETPANSQQRNMARKSFSLPLRKLIGHAHNLLTPKGHIFLILPVDKEALLVEILKTEKLFLARLCQVKGNFHSPVKRILVDIVKQPVNTEYSQLIIEKERHVYTQKYIELTRDFYLKMV